MCETSCVRTRELLCGYGLRERYSVRAYARTSVWIWTTRTIQRACVRANFCVDMDYENDTACVRTRELLCGYGLRERYRVRAHARTFVWIWTTRTIQRACVRANFCVDMDYENDTECVRTRELLCGYGLRERYSVRAYARTSVWIWTTRTIQRTWVRANFSNTPAEISKTS